MAGLALFRSTADTLRRAARSTADSVNNILLGTEEDAVVNRDPIMEVVAQNPQEAIRFIKLVMLFGATTGVLVSVPCVVYLILYWDECRCNKPLQWWVLVFSALQVSQVPVRYLFFFHLHATRDNRASIINTTRTLTGGRGWKCSKFVSILSYGWFILGVVWVFNAHECSEAPGLWKLTVSAIVVSVLRLVTTFVCFWISFPPNAGGLQTSDRFVGAATPEQIAKLPLLSYAQKKAQLCSRVADKAVASSVREERGESTWEEDCRKDAGQTEKLAGFIGTEQEAGRRDEQRSVRLRGRPAGAPGVDENQAFSSSISSLHSSSQHRLAASSPSQKPRHPESVLDSSLGDSRSLPLASAVDSPGARDASCVPPSSPLEERGRVGAQHMPANTEAMGQSKNAIPRGAARFRGPAADHSCSLETPEELGSVHAAVGAAHASSSDASTRKGAHFSSVQENCCICLGEFADEEVIRELRCSHFFHQGCIDKWLLKNKQCPLCLRSIDEAFDPGTVATENTST
ncbi:hypothetical protein NCLIV_050670 [Neospora caninum Liverpool]|uniref:E3 ubiquitin-protein ligase At1g63170 n=1 Tax=Neospora caninum (strain Liverpool) TaxID=572307 RepID=F0VKN8_NEOCL|nr:hypothetical protein NCLIV_050670 [Neospora caninum Liverpool]CBZ54639.1 hypothetical protein NCLIV_050670 [Neospora caninum Liverpool]CEL69355.1 TPA: E3 ubiquitin-protein ligase At1g63170 [Neospora caninum Liverpool]|eukprot:XP_003884669.1 hypothetical protein NCLIV_050670 [Neospora caninum Liverpool]